MKHKKLFITAIVIFSVVVFLAILTVLWYWGDSYADFVDFTSSAEIPGLKDGAVPQGMANYTTTYTDENGKELKQEYLFISAYMKNGPSRLYVTGTRTGYVGYVTLKNEDGTDYYGHAGGVATSCNNSDSSGNKTVEKNGTLWVVSDGTVYCAKRSSPDYDNIAEEVITKAALKDGEQSIKFTASFKAYNGASFCYFYEDGTTSVSNDKLYVGEFYREGDKRYSTDTNHHITTNSGKEQHAYVYEYTSSTSSSNKYGVITQTDTYIMNENNTLVRNDVPKIQNIYSIPAKIQGFARTNNGSLILSESYGLANSHLYYFNWSEVFASSNRTSFRTLTGTNFEYEGYYTQHSNKYTVDNLNVYFIDESKLVRNYSIPSMSEGLCASGDRVYVLFESGCYKYKTFVRQRITDVHYFTPRV